MKTFRVVDFVSLRAASTLVFAFIAAVVCVELHTPLPWMIGPLLTTATLSILGVRTASWNPLRNTAQWVIGTALGLYFTPQVSALVVGLWWVIILSIIWSLALGYYYGQWLYWYNAPRFSGLDRVTTYFASLIGGASEMTLLAEREMARTDLVASAHSLRVLLVTVTVPSAIQLSGWHGVDPALNQAHPFHLNGFVTLMLCTGGGAWVMKLFGRSNAWFIGSLLVSIALTVNECELSSIPSWVTNAAQLAIGVSLGVRFTPQFIHTAPRWLASVTIGTFVMILASALLSLGLSQLIDLHVATMILSNAPGGIAEMAITAKVLQLGVAVVTALQACRIIAVLFLAEPLFRWLKSKDTRSNFWASN